MKRDPLEALLRLRRMAVDTARHDLADCLRAESEAQSRVAAITASIEHEAAVAADLTTGDAEVEAFAAWLRRIRPVQRAAEAVLQEAAAETAQARAVLARRCNPSTRMSCARRPNATRSVNWMMRPGGASSGLDTLPSLRPDTEQ
jgi:hypothetical protein